VVVVMCALPSSLKNVGMKAQKLRLLQRGRGPSCLSKGGFPGQGSYSPRGNGDHAPASKN